MKHRKQLLPSLFIVALVLMVGVTTYVATRSEPQTIPSKAESPCSATLKIIPENSTFDPGGEFSPKIFVDLQNTKLMMAVVTLNYDLTKMHLDPNAGQRQDDGSLIIVDYDRDERLSNELAAIIELPNEERPDESKINVVASCSVNALGQCNTVVSGNNVLLATLPIEINEDAMGGFNLDVQYAGCGDEEGQSVVFEDTGDVGGHDDILGSVQHASYTIIPPVTSTTTPTATPTLIPVNGDITQDGKVDARDSSVLVSNWGESAPWQCPLDVPDCNPDLDGSGVVEGRDASILVGNWSRSE